MLKVNEIFGPTVQGEGKSAGMPCAFMRLVNCNLHCIWCDTPHTWNWVGTTFAHPEKFNIKDETHSMTDEEVINKLQSIGVPALVISGGEPLLQHKQLVSLCQKLRALGYWIEIETNGTIYPNEELISLVDQINCSPKLSNSLEPKHLRIYEKTLAKLAALKKVNFKFVISTQQDVDEALALVKTFAMKDIRFMPEGRTKEEILTRGLWVRKLCAEHDFIFSTRLSILTAGTTRGV